MKKKNACDESVVYSWGKYNDEPTGTSAGGTRKLLITGSVDSSFCGKRQLASNHLPPYPSLDEMLIHQTFKIIWSIECQVV